MLRPGQQPILLLPNARHIYVKIEEKDLLAGRAKTAASVNKEFGEVRNI